MATWGEQRRVQITIGFQPVSEPVGQRVQPVRPVPNSAPYRRDAYGTLGLRWALFSRRGAKPASKYHRRPACGRGWDRAAGTFTIEHQRQNLRHAYLVC